MIDAFQISTAVTLSTSIGFAYIAYEATRRLKQARGHVSNLQKHLHEAFDELDLAERKIVELDKIVTKVQAQRLKALERAVAANKARGEARKADKARATEKTLSALQAAPLRPRDEVVANIRGSKAAQTVSSGG